jgi:hypothetical protein
MRNEKIGEDHGKVLGTRILCASPHEVKVETTFNSTGNLYGFDFDDMGTFISSMRSDGTMVGEGQGVMVTKDGETATWHGTGLGKKTGTGLSSSWRSTIYYQTKSGKLDRLNQTVALCEYDIDADGNCRTTYFEWLKG